MLVAVISPPKTLRLFTSAAADAFASTSLDADALAFAEPVLTIGAPVEAADDRLRELLADRVPTIFCGHGETLPGQLAVICGDLHAEPPPAPALEKGSFWVLHVRQGTDGAAALAALERHAP
jgi:hypothetical protein